MARGAEGKKRVIKILEKAFGEDYIGEVDKKIYVWTNDGAERVQIAISLTCPKTFVDVPDKHPVEKEDWDFSDDGIKEPAPVKRATISEEEKQKIADLMKSLGL